MTCQNTDHNGQSGITVLSPHITLAHTGPHSDINSDSISSERGELGLMIQFAPADILIVSNTSFSLVTSSSHLPPPNTPSHFHCAIQF